MKRPDEDNLDTNTLSVRRLGIDTHQEPVLYMREDCPVCRSEGFEAQSRVKVRVGECSVIATLDVVTEVEGRRALLELDEAGLSEAAWRLLDEPEGKLAQLSHPPPVESLHYVRSKIYGHRLGAHQLRAIMRDIVDGQYADVHLAAFITAGADDGMDEQEIIDLTKAMIEVGQCLEWDQYPVVDKHCVGGLPGNRTTPLVVPIVAAYGLTMPKTSSRAITSPAGTADTMATLAPVELSVDKMKEVVDKVGGCIAWGGGVHLSPADDVLIRVERLLDVDSEGQLIASVLSKKVAAGSSHVVLDVPVGPTAKVRSKQTAERIGGLLETVGEALDIQVRVVYTDGTQPVGRGIGPALEARDVLAVLAGEDDAPTDLRERAIELAGHLLEISDGVAEGDGYDMAAQILDDGRAWQKFAQICEAQGGMREPPSARYQHPVLAPRAGCVTAVDNRRLARVAKLAGAPNDPAAGLAFHARLGTEFEKGQPMFTIHAESPGELDYALTFIEEHDSIITLESP